MEYSQGDGLTLRQKTIGKQVTVLDLGFQGHAGRSPLFQLLDKFSPVQYVSPSFLARATNEAFDQKDSSIEGIRHLQQQHGLDYSAVLSIYDSTEHKEELLNERWQSKEELQKWSITGLSYKFEVLEDKQRQSNVLCINNKLFTPGQIFDYYPQLGEAIRKQISPRLFCRIPLSLPNASGDVPESFHLLNDRIDKVPIDSLDASKPAVRFANIIIMWNLIQHFYPYWNEITCDWESVLLKSLTDADTNQTSDGFYLTLNRMLEAISDGHVHVSYKTSAKLGYLPFYAELLDSQLVVFYSKDAILHKGDIITSIDGEPTQKLIQRKQTLISGSRQWKNFVVTRRYGQRSFDSGVYGSSAQIVVLRQDSILRLNIVRSDTDVAEVQSIKIPPRKPIEMLEDSVYYIDLGRVTYTDFSNRIHDFLNARGIIFDMRAYPTDGALDIIAHLTDRPFSSAKYYIPLITYPDHERLAGIDSTMMWKVSNRYPRIKTTSIFIQDNGCISAAEGLMAIVEHYRLGEIVGDTTAGTNGNWNPVKLIGGFSSSFTGMRVLKHNGGKHHNVGISPTIPIRKSMNGVRNGLDEYLMTALQLIKAKTRR